MVKKESKKLKERVLSRSRAYLYLKGLLEKSIDFKEKVEILRGNLGIEFGSDKNLSWDDISPKEQEKLALKTKLSEEEIKIYRRTIQKLEAFIRPPQLTANKEFINLCEFYYMPKEFWHNLEIFIYTGNANKILNNNIKTVAMPGKTPQVNHEDFLIPHIVLFVPLDTSKIKFINSWNEVEASLNFVKKRWVKVEEWREGISFDKAIIIYKIYKKFMPNEKELKKMLWETGLFKRESMIDTKEAYRLLRRIEEQIESLKNLKKLVSENWF